MIIKRYLSREILLSFLAVTLILLLIALSNQFVGLLSKAASGQIPVHLVFQVMGLYIPELLSLLAPLGFFVAILLTLGRLHADSEMVILFTCGIDWSRLTRIILTLGGVLAVGVAFLTLWVVPKVTEFREQILANGEAIGIMQSITPGRFQSMNDGRLVFYVEDIAPKDKNMRHVFIAEQPEEGALSNEPWAILTAETASLQQTHHNQFYMILKKGRRYLGAPGQADYTVTDFEEYGREVQTPADPVPSFMRLRSTTDLLHSKSPGDVAELHWRLGLPATLLILSLLALPLSKVNPRQGRFAKLLPAILLFIIYYNLLTLCKREISDGTLPHVSVFWGLHFLFLIIACILLARISGQWQYWKHSKSRKTHKTHENSRSAEV